GLRTRSRIVCPSKPLAGLTFLQFEKSTLSIPLSMYPAVEIMSLPYLPGWPSKHLPASGGIGPVAGIDIRRRKSPVGCVRVKTIVELFGVLMPLIDFALPDP